MVVSVSKHIFQRSAPKELVYRDCKNFDSVFFKIELEDKLNQQMNEHKHFEQMLLEILNIHAPKKKKLLWANHIPYMTKVLRITIMKRSELEGKYRNYLKERPGLNERPLRMSASLHSWKIWWAPRFKWAPPETGKGVPIWKFAMSAEAPIQIISKNDETRVFFSQIFFVFHSKEIYI